jgi:predicted NACHT family NTPase
MNDVNFSIDLGLLITYAEDRILGIFGKDVLSSQQKEQLQRLMELAVQRAASVMCIGMDRPIPIEDIYQPTRLQSRQLGYSFDLKGLLSQKRNAAIFAGPGRGKTTFLHWVFMTMIRSSEYLPVLITLRRSDALSELKDFVVRLRLSQRRQKKLKGPTTLLLVDGYDEITQGQRKEVSECLQEFSSLEAGNYFLTCSSIMT